MSLVLISYTKNNFIVALSHTNFVANDILYFFIYHWRLNRKVNANLTIYQNKVFILNKKKKTKYFMGI